MISTELLQSILFVVAGFLVGGCVPFALFYLALYVKRHAFSWKTALGFLIRLVSVPIVLILTIAIAGLVLHLSGLEPEDPLPASASYFGYAAGLGLVGGIVAFVAGVISATSSKRRRLEEAPPNAN